MKDTFQTNRRDLRRAHLAVILLTLIFAFGCLLLAGDLNEHLLTILAFGAVVVVPVFMAHQFLCAWMLDPVRQVLGRTEESGPPPQRLVRRAIESLELFPFREALASLVIWIAVVVLLAVVIGLSASLTRWQILVLGVLGVSVGLVDGLLGYHANNLGLRKARVELEGLISGDEPVKTGAGRLSRRIVNSLLVVLLVAVVVSSLLWLSGARRQKAVDLMAEVEPVLKQVSGKLGAALEKDPKADLRATIRKADPNGLLQNSLVVLDAKGKILLSTAPVEADPEWFGKIVKNEVNSWHEMRAPFLYMVRSISKGRSLLWVESLEPINSAIGSFAWKGILGVILVLIFCIGTAWSVVNSNFQPLENLTERVRKLARGGKLQTLPKVGGEGDLAALTNALGELVTSVRHTMQSTEETAQTLYKESDRLKDRVGRFRDASERRTNVAEQTAASVVEMRSSIQSISEQMEALRGASSDCTSAMFEIDQSVREVASSAENLQNMVDDTASAMTEITASMDQVTSNVDELAKTAEETVASIAVIDGSIKQVEDSTARTHRLSEEVGEFANRGAQSVRQTIAGINEIQQITDEAREVINRLGTQMEAVGKILTVISDVAEQTNLLALNAAIIAAAAGEHGKGFAVVADEIKDLADRTSTSTKEIAGLIRSVQSESRHAIDAMQRGSGSVTRGSELANNAGEALSQILSSVQQVTQMANDIATSTAEHSSITRAITKSMASISTMVREIKRAVAEQSQGGNRVNRVSEQMRDDARFVFRSANEQVQAATGVTKNMGRISEMVAFVSKAMAEQSNGVNHVAKVTEEVRDTFDQERVQLADLEEVADQIGRQASEFIRQLEDMSRAGEGES